MSEIVEIIKEFFLETVGKELCVFFCSMIPIIELRGAIPMGAAFDAAYGGMPFWFTYFLSVAGNMLPVPFILLFIKGIIRWMSNSKVKFFNKVANFLLKRVEKKRLLLAVYFLRLGTQTFLPVTLSISKSYYQKRNP